MKPIRWSAHPRKKAAKHEGAGKRSGTDHHPTEFHCAGTMATPGFFMRRYFDEILEIEMLLRVAVEETDMELTVVTLYKTSKFAKYEAGA